MRTAINDILFRHWGYDSFRPMQEDIILSVLNGNDTLGLLPTGGGKSITFQVPALVFEGLTIVVTPLISLMKDQVDNLRQRDIKAIYLHAGLTPAENRLAIDRCRYGKVKLLYVSPEKLQSERFIDELRFLNISLIVVDEAHCISQWGYDFRPSYLRISSLRTLFPDAPILALTASATPEVVDDIMTRLQFRSRKLFSRSFSRDNISYIVRNDDNKEQQMLRILNATTGTAIVYVRSRRRTREIAELLSKNDFTADFYHAGLAPEDKNDKQNRWKNDEIRIIVATNAFGMGIDKPDVRTVIHYDLPSSLEEYYQEAGRAGRDGLPSYAVLLASRTDKAQLTRHITEQFPPKELIRRVYELAGNFVEVAVGDGYNQVYDFNFTLFCKQFELRPTETHSALRLLTQAGYIEYIEELSTRSRIMVLLTKHELYGINLDTETDRVFQLILRTYSGLFADYVYISEALIARRTELTEQAVYEALLRLSRMHVIHYVPRKSTPYLYYTTSRELPRYIQLPPSIYEDMRTRLEQRIEAIKRFAFDSSECRVNTMLRYFGEYPQQPCGKCDVCRSHTRMKAHASLAISLRDSLLYMTSQQPRTLDYLTYNASAPRTEVIETLRLLLDEELIVTDGRTYFSNSK